MKQKEFENALVGLQLSGKIGVMKLKGNSATFFLKIRYSEIDECIEVVDKDFGYPPLGKFLSDNDWALSDIEYIKIPQFMFNEEEAKLIKMSLKVGGELICAKFDKFKKEVKLAFKSGLLFKVSKIDEVPDNDIFEGIHGLFYSDDIEAMLCRDC